MVKCEGIRKQFGKKISQFQAISFKLADMYKKIEASEMLIYQAAQLKNQNKKVSGVVFNLVAKSKLTILVHNLQYEVWF